MRSHEQLITPGMAKLVEFRPTPSPLVGQDCIWGWSLVIVGSEKIHSFKRSSVWPKIRIVNSFFVKHVVFFNLLTFFTVHLQYCHSAQNQTKNMYFCQGLTVVKSVRKSIKSVRNSRKSVRNSRKSVRKVENQWEKVENQWGKVENQWGKEENQWRFLVTVFRWKKSIS